MSTATLVSESEYLRTTYRPDVDFLEGELLERNMGEQQHAAIQGFLTTLFRNHRDDWHVRALPEQRLQVGPGRYRIPDVCVLRSSDPWDPVVRFKPLLCIEVLSTRDTLRSIQERVDDYTTLGVAHVWVLDPWKRRGYQAVSGVLEQPKDGVLRAEGAEMSVSLAEVFAELGPA